MAKRRIIQWMETATIVLYSLRKTGNDAMKALMANKPLLGKPTLEAPQKLEIPSKAQEVGLKTIREMELPDPPAHKKTEGEQKSDDSSYGGIFAKAPIRKTNSKQ